MNHMIELDRLNRISSVLSANIPEPDVEKIPVEVVETLQVAKRQMREIPVSLKDLAAAGRDFAILDKAIDRLLEIVNESISLPEDDDKNRETLQNEMVRLADIVARVAGRKEYGGPSLSVRTKAEAQGSAKILRHLGPVKDTLAAQLVEQKELIEEAVLQTIEFLKTVAESFPDSPSVVEIPVLLRRVECIRHADTAPANGLH